MKFFGLFNHGKKREKISKLKREIIREDKKALQKLRTVNKKIKLLLDEGQVEVVIKNVRGVLKEL